MQRRRRKLTIQDILKVAIEDIDASINEKSEEDKAASALANLPLWEPFPVMPGRGITLPDGRVVSPQMAALESEADELLFGGTPGGGKSGFLFGAALTKHRDSIIFRREYAQMRGSEGLLSMSRNIIGDRGKFDGTMWRGLPGNRTLEFGAIEHLHDREKWKGRAHDGKFFDEITDFLEAQYRYVIGWTRTKHAGQRCRVICTCNPPTTEEGQWVNSYWGPWLDQNHPRPAKPGELRWYVVDADGKDQEVPSKEPVLIGGDSACAHVLDAEQRCSVCVGRFVVPKSRTFIPSFVEDNPLLMGTGYAQQLDNLPEPLRSQMRFGNFQAAQGDHPMQVIPRAWVVAAQARWRPDGGIGKALSAVGVDPSRGGQDEFAMAKRYENWVDTLILHAAKEAPDGHAGAMLVAKAVGMDRTVPVQIDVCGEAGPSVYDHAGRKPGGGEEAGFGLKAVALNGARKSTRKDKSGSLRFFNKRTEWHWRMREALDPTSGLEIALPPDSQLRSDLCAPRWELTLTGQIKVELKEEIKGRIGRSPDRGEAVLYAFAQQDHTEHGLLGVGGESTSEVDELEAQMAALKREMGVR